VSVPVLAIYGGEDPAAAASEGDESNFTGPYRRVIVAGAGHFVQREQPDETTRLLLEWFGVEEREATAVAAATDA
jgi:pimeloyl-ACP methyl ester carboxylesterase